MVAVKDKKSGEAALVLLRSQRRNAEEAELRLLSDWAAWTEALSSANLPLQGSEDPLFGYDLVGHALKLSSLRSSEHTVLAEAQRFVAKAAAAKGFNASAIRLLSAYERGLELAPSLLAGEKAIVALKNEQLKNLLAAALSARPRLYLEALSIALPEDGRKRGKAAAEAFRSALFDTPEDPLAKTTFTWFAAAAALGAEAAVQARILGMYYTGADFYGFLSLLPLARPDAEREFLVTGGIIDRTAYSFFDAASDYKPWPRPELSDENRQSASLLYSAWLSAQLRKDSAEASRFALLSVAPALNELLQARVAAVHKASLEQSFERLWLEAGNALSLDLRADALLWLRSIGQKPAPATLSLEARVSRWPKLPFTAGIEIALKAEGKEYTLPYTAIAASLQSSLRSVFGGALPAFVYLEARGEAAERFTGPAERSEQALEALGEDLEMRYPLGMAWSVEAWMVLYVRQSTHVRMMARFYAQTAQAARVASEAWYAILAGRTPAVVQP